MNAEWRNAACAQSDKLANITPVIAASVPCYAGFKAPVTPSKAEKAWKTMTQISTSLRNNRSAMKNRLKIYTVSGFAVVAFLLAQLGCSSKTETAAQPSPTPDTAMALTSPTPTPTPEATPDEKSAQSSVASNTAARSRAAASSARPRAGNSNPEPDPGYAPAAPSRPAREEPAPPAREYTPPPPRVFTIREGTTITISTDKTITTKLDKNGDRFTGSLTNSIVDGDWVIAKRGALVEGEIVNSDPGGRVSGRAVLTVRLRSLQLADGRKVSFDQLLHQGG
jgi:hypothetical protein